MSSRTHRDEGPETAPSPSVPGEFPVNAGRATGGGGLHHGRRRRWGIAALVAALVLALAAAGYLLVVARSWQERAESLEDTARELGGELGQVRAELEESRSTLSLVETQLEAAQDQIHELADAVAQTGDDREVQRQVLEYQAQLSASATAVAGAMEQCITGQETLLAHLEAAARPAPSPSASPGEPEEPEVDLAALREQVDGVCAQADEAHAGLQERLEDQ